MEMENKSIDPISKFFDPENNSSKFIMQANTLRTKLYLIFACYFGFFGIFEVTLIQTVDKSYYIEAPLFTAAIVFFAFFMSYRHCILDLSQKEFVIGRRFFSDQHIAFDEVLAVFADSDPHQQDYYITILFKDGLKLQTVDKAKDIDDKITRGKQCDDYEQASEKAKKLAKALEANFVEPQEQCTLRAKKDEHGEIILHHEHRSPQDVQKRIIRGFVLLFFFGTLVLVMKWPVALVFTAMVLLSAFLYVKHS